MTKKLRGASAPWTVGQATGLDSGLQLHLIMVPKLEWLTPVYEACIGDRASYTEGGGPAVYISDAYTYNLCLYWLHSEHLFFAHRLIFAFDTQRSGLKTSGSHARSYRLDAYIWTEKQTHRTRSHLLRASRSWDQHRRNRAGGGNALRRRSACYLQYR